MEHGSRRLLVTLMVVFVIGAVSVSAASAALPEFVLGTGAPPSFESILKTTKLETVGAGVRVTCRRGVDHGAVTGIKTVAMTVILRECGIPGAAVPCGSPGAQPGEIVAPSLTGTLGYIRKPTVVGLAVSSSAPPITSFVCGSGELHIVEGSVIGKITPINVIVTPPEHYTLTFTQKEGKQKPRKFAGGPEDILFTSISPTLLIESGLSATDELFFSTPMQIKA
jgi:hypothetical protein